MVDQWIDVGEENDEEKYKKIFNNERIFKGFMKGMKFHSVFNAFLNFCFWTISFNWIISVTWWFSICWKWNLKILWKCEMRDFYGKRISFYLLSFIFNHFSSFINVYRISFISFYSFIMKIHFELNVLSLLSRINCGNLEKRVFTR